AAGAARQETVQAEMDVAGMLPRNGQRPMVYTPEAVLGAERQYYRSLNTSVVSGETVQITFRLEASGAVAAAALYSAERPSEFAGRVLTAFQQCRFQIKAHAKPPLDALPDTQYLLWMYFTRTWPAPIAAFGGIDLPCAIRGDKALFEQLAAPQVRIGFAIEPDERGFSRRATLIDSSGVPALDQIIINSLPTCPVVRSVDVYHRWVDAPIGLFALLKRP
ncbi:MAG TPA: hypothetical protein VFK82_10070, partial [Burkholderiaceae bacterium]|nr:hypothetical protein [Burkholderiaceae bacterium]